MNYVIVRKGNDIVVKNNDLINSRHELTLSEMRIILHMITLIHKDDEDFKEYRIFIRDFVDKTETKHKGEYERAKEITRKLLERVLEVPKGKGFLQTHWISSVEYYDGKGYVDLTFDSKLKPYLLQLKKRFTKYNIQHILHLRSVYSIRIYELLKQYEKIGERIIDVDNLKTLLMIEDKYKLYADFKRRVLNNSCKELKKHTDIYFNFNEIKVGRRVKKIKFIIIPNENKTSAVLPEDTNFKSLISLLPKEHRDKKTIHNTLSSSYKKHGFDYVARNIKYTNRNCKGNYRAYLNKALKEDWGLAIHEDEEGKQKIIKEQAQKRQQEREALKQQRELQNQVREHMETLSPEELDALRKEAISQLDEEIKKNGKRVGNIELLVRMEMEEIVGERLEVGECR